jgi:hypothetical protein
MLFLVLLACAIPATLSADERRGVITLIPTDVLTSKAQSDSAEIAGGSFGTERILLRFQASSLPAQAKVTAARLSLVASESAGAQQTINVHQDSYDATLSSQPSPQNVFGATTASFAKKQRVYWDANPTFLEKINAAGRKFSLLLTTTSSAKSAWYLVKSSDSSKRPRLILEYTVADQPAVTQSDGLPAVQSARPFLPTQDGCKAKAGDPPFFCYVTRSFSNAWSYTPAFYNNLVYLMTDNKGKKALQALHPLGGNPVWTMEVDGEPGQHLLVSQSGRLYIVGNKKILVYQLHPSNAVTPATQVQTSEGKPLSIQPPPDNNINPSLAPAVGPDGSLYFVNGQEAYGLNPDLQELWKVTLANKTTSRVTVGPSGRFVYLTVKSPETKSATNENEGLVAINAQTGESFPNSLPNQDTLTSFHAPVVILHPDGSEKIYVAANSVNDGVLACFNNRSGKITAAEKWPGPDLKGLWSQPILDQLSPGSKEQPTSGKQIYAVRVTKSQGILTGIDWLTGATKALAPTFAVGDSPYLLVGGNLALDQTGNRFVWNGKGDIGLYTFGTAFSGPLASSASGIPMQAQLFFGSDGTLYANTVDGDRVLRAIVPRYTLSADSKADISSPTHLWVDGVVDTGKKTELKAAGSVLLGPGFTVKPGATLKIATGTPKP